MAVYKEIGHLVKEINNKSRQVWVDSCDYGMPIKTLNDPIIQQVKDIFLPMCDGKVETYKYETGATQKMVFDGGWPAVIEAGFEKCTLEFIQVKNNKNLIGFINVTIETSPEALKKARNYDN